MSRTSALFMRDTVRVPSVDVNRSQCLLCPHRPHTATG
ncbi:hypothetical protein KNT75_gp82 [Gordonia phage Kabluna]|uniref:Uncharacterized protein n=1 Tax=Gordonia phage Kabluna TaxID=2041511 RepID=A0A2D1GCM1_9CAUD|nr:hypothetical protein KNT75_gp82 [Gordonia phage Kabluna]ATN89615.1 hypothetical protein SEA_KABLUNA_82 [Gordonia phage Kabluna]